MRSYQVNKSMFVKDSCKKAQLSDEDGGCFAQGPTFYNNQLFL